MLPFLLPQWPICASIGGVLQMSILKVCTPHIYNRNVQCLQCNAANVCIDTSLCILYRQFVWVVHVKYIMWVHIVRTSLGTLFALCMHVLLHMYVQMHLIMKEIGVKLKQKRSLSHNNSSATLPTAPLRWWRKHQWPMKTSSCNVSLLMILPTKHVIMFLLQLGHYDTVIATFCPLW